MAVGSNLNYQAQIDSLVADVKSLAGLQFPDGYVESVVEAYLEENHANLVTTEELNNAKYEILSDISESFSNYLSNSGGTMTGELEMDNASILIDATEGTTAGIEMTADADSSVEIKVKKVSAYEGNYPLFASILPDELIVGYEEYCEEYDETGNRVRITPSYVYIEDTDDWYGRYGSYDIKTNESSFAIAHSSVHFWIMEDSIYAYCPSDSSFYLDLGTSSRKWNNIYATNGTIQTSDRNEKENIVDMTDEHSKAFIMGLNPVSYKMKNGTSGRTHYGLIAQEVETLLAELGITSTDFAGFIKSPKIVEKVDEKGKITRTEIEGEYNYALRYDEFIAPLIKVVQAQQAEIEELKTALNELKQN